MEVTVLNHKLDKAIFCVGIDFCSAPPQDVFHGGHKRQLIRPRTNNFLSLVWNITKLPHMIELAIPKNPIVFVFRFCYILAGK